MEKYSTPYELIVNGVGVCAGYANAFLYFMERLGIEAYFVTGLTVDGASHGWNIVKINGEYYHVDVTWDDNEDITDGIDYSYFNVSDSVMRISRVWDVEMYPACTSDKYDNNYWGY